MQYNNPMPEQEQTELIYHHREVRNHAIVTADFFECTSFRQRRYKLSDVRAVRAEKTRIPLKEHLPMLILAAALLLFGLLTPPTDATLAALERYAMLFSLALLFTALLLRSAWVLHITLRDGTQVGERLYTRRIAAAFAQAIQEALKRRGR